MNLRMVKKAVMFLVDRASRMAAAFVDWLDRKVLADEEKVKKAWLQKDNEERKQ